MIPQSKCQLFLKLRQLGLGSFKRMSSLGTLRFRGLPATCVLLLRSVLFGIHHQQSPARNDFCEKLSFPIFCSFYTVLSEHTPQRKCSYAGFKFLTVRHGGANDELYEFIL